MWAWLGRVRKKAALEIWPDGAGVPSIELRDRCGASGRFMLKGVFPRRLWASSLSRLGLCVGIARMRPSDTARRRINTSIGLDLDGHELSVLLLILL